MYYLFKKLEKTMKFKQVVSLVVVLAMAAAVNAAELANFEETQLLSESHYGGADSNVNVGFTSGDAYFSHTSAEYSWEGFSYSNETDTTTAGYTNQFSAYVTDGDGHAYTAGDNQYGICYVPNDWLGGTYDQLPQTTSFGDNTSISGMWVTNTTYAYLAILNGEGGATAFSDGDWFQLTVKGIDAEGEYTDTVDFLLADFQNGNSTIIDQWTWVDLSDLGSVAGLEFNLTSSDTGDYGINTPSYFAMDNLNGSPLDAPVPEPMTFALFGLGGLFIRRKMA